MAEASQLKAVCSQVEAAVLWEHLISLTVLVVEAMDLSEHSPSWVSPAAEVSSLEAFCGEEDIALLQRCRSSVVPKMEASLLVALYLEVEVMALSEHFRGLAAVVLLVETC